MHIISIAMVFLGNNRPSYRIHKTRSSHIIYYNKAYITFKCRAFQITTTIDH